MLQQEIKKHRTRRVLYIVLAAMLVPVFLKRSGTAASVGELLAFTVAVWCLNAAKNERMLIARLKKDETTDKGN